LGLDFTHVLGNKTYVSSLIDGKELNRGGLGTSVGLENRFTLGFSCKLQIDPTPVESPKARRSPVLDISKAFIYPFVSF